jgi:heme exporter protein C
MFRLANPNRFMQCSGKILPWCAIDTVLLLGAGLYLALFVAPPDYQQGESVRIMYVHVPSAYMATTVYAVMAAASAMALIWRHPVADIAAREAAPLGAGFTLLCLVTGSLWGKPMWGTWWVWDARLTSVLVLFFLYLGYIALINALRMRINQSVTKSRVKPSAMTASGHSIDAAMVGPPKRKMLAG